MENNNSPSISSVPVAPKKKYQRKPKEEISVEEVPKVVEVVEKVEVQEKAKRGQSEKTKAALAKGREKLAEINKQRKAERQAIVSEKINQKAERIAEQKVKMLKELNLDEEDSDEDIVAKPLKPVKAAAPVIKKKAPRIVYVDEEEESEEEVVYRSRPAPKKKASAPVPAFSGIQFY